MLFYEIALPMRFDLYKTIVIGTAIYSLMTNQEHKATISTIRCGHCGNKTLMKIISEGNYRQEILWNSDDCYAV